MSLVDTSPPQLFFYRGGTAPIPFPLRDPKGKEGRKKVCGSGR